MRFLVALFALAIFCVPTAHAQESFLCIGDLTTGFRYDKTQRAWRTTNFKSGDRYVVTRSKAGGWQVKEFGKDMAQECGQFNDAGNLFCGRGETFRMSRNTLRFLRTFPNAYWFNQSAKDDEGGDTPFIEIGKCSGLN